MPGKNTAEESEFPTSQGMQRWLEREVADIMKATELRIKDATRFVNAYARGEITADQAAEHSYRYGNRWGDALPGVVRTAGMSDEEILQRMDASLEEGFVRKFAKDATRAKQERG